jgi:hypothetical protein
MARSSHKTSRSKSPTKDSSRTEPPRDAPIAWSPRRRAIVSVLVAFHLSAVVVAPWYHPDPSSEVSAEVAEVYMPYLDGVFINHGYRFFNQVGRGHLVLYEIDLPDGTTVKGALPDRDAHVPRLHYHRLLMLSEQKVAGMVPTVPADPRLLNPPPGFHIESEGERLDYEVTRRSYYERLGRAQKAIESISSHLLSEHDAVEVRLAIQERLLPTHADILAGVEMTDKRFLQVRPLGHLRPGETWKWTEQILGTGKPIYP